MADAFRRVILKPPGVTAEQIARLADALQGAVNVHNRLAAKSPYILRYTGSLEQDENGFSIPHEPATALTPTALFDATHPTASEDELIQTAAALVDALAAAHAAAGGRPTIHGGLCPGALLTAEDGLIRVADFGVAPAMCKVLGVDSYLNLAVGPQANCSGAWEVLTAGVVDRDDRLCAFIDPDKYGSESLTSFETGSDIVAAGFILYLLAEHNHPYLFFEREAHRVVDMARMMGFGVPNALSRKDLRESTNPAIRTWWELVTTMVARLPRERPTASDLAQRFQPFVQANLDTVKAKRWLVQLESLLQAKAWKDFEIVMKDRPTVQNWPADLLARVEELRGRVKEAIAEEARRAAIEADQRVATEWFDRVQDAVRAEEWEGARRLLKERPELKRWPQDVEQKLAPLAARIKQEWEQQKVEVWQESLRQAYEGRDWALVGKRLEYRPAVAEWPRETQEFIAAVEAEYQQRLAEQEREQRRIARQHAEARNWLDRAKALADAGRWDAALDALGQPPELENWPPGGRLEAEQLAQRCRQHLGESIADNLDAVAESITRLAQAIVQDVAAERLARLVRPDRIETTTDLVVWTSPDPEADGHAQVFVRLPVPGEPVPDEPIQGELDFRLRKDQVEICGRQVEFGERVAQGLAQRLSRLQSTRLPSVQRDLRAGLFPKAEVRAQLEGLEPQIAAEIELLGAGTAEGALQADLHWDAGEWTWQPAEPGAFATRVLEIATAVTQRAVLSDLLARSEMLRTYERTVVLGLTLSPMPAKEQIPKALAFDARIMLSTGARGQPQVLAAGRATCEKVGRARTEIDLAAAEARLRELVVASQDESRQALEGELKELVRLAPSKLKLGAPKRSKTPVAEIAFEVKPKSGEPLAQKAVWNTARLLYELPAGWKEKIAGLGAPPAPAVVPVEAKPKPVAKPETPPKIELPREAPLAREAPRVVEKPKSVAKPAKPERKEPPPKAPAAAPPRRRGLVIGVGLAGLAVVGVGLYVVLGRGSSPPPPPPPTGACCLTDGSCQVQTETACGQAGGQYRGSGTACDPNPCAPQPAPTGACCAADGSCQVKTETACGQAGGQYRGSGTGCEPNPCAPPPPPTGACCAADGSCQVQPETACSETRGRYQGHKTACEPNPCAQPTGACCFEDGSCRPLSATACGTGGGRYQGNNTACEPNPCAQPAGACCFEDGNCRALTATACAAAAGKHRGSNTACDPNPCPQPPKPKLPPWPQKQAELKTQGYTAGGEIDPDSGYPLKLTDSKRRELLLVSIPPGDEVWNGLKPLAKPDGALGRMAAANADDRRWLLYYIDADEQPVAGFDQATAAAKKLGREVPTRDEWVLAALKLRANLPADLIGGRRKWCADDSGESAGKGHWACGGVTRKVQGRDQLVPPLPKNPSDIAELWAWLNNPLVMQRRDARFGDELTAVRPVLRIQK